MYFILHFTHYYISIQTNHFYLFNEIIIQLLVMQYVYVFFQHFNKYLY